MKSPLLIIAAFLAMCSFFIYHTTLFYYTSYGVFKAYNEYFCKNPRAGLRDSRIMTFSNILFVNSYEVEEKLFGRSFPNFALISTDGLSLSSMTYNHTITKNGYTISLDSKNIVKVFDNIEGWYKVDNKYFDLYCMAETTNPKSLNTARIDQDGFLYEGYPTHSKLDGLNLNYTVACKQNRFTETCDVGKEVTNSFLAIYFKAIIPICMFASLLLSSSFQFEFVGILARRLLRNTPKLSFYPNFCNPITQDPVFLKRGAKITKLTSAKGEYVSIGRLRTFSDKELDLTVYNENNAIVIFKKSQKAEDFRLEAAQMEQLKRYLYNITIDNSLACVNGVETHYLKTSEVIEELSRGKYLSVEKKEKSTYVNDVHELEFKLIKQMFRTTDQNIKFLLHHNWTFFKKSYNLEALISVLKNKAWFSDRLTSVNNSTWKFYTSDLSHFFAERTDRKINVQTKWFKSKAYNSCVADELQDRIAYHELNDILHCEKVLMEENVRTPSVLDSYGELSIRRPQHSPYIKTLIDIEDTDCGKVHLKFLTEIRETRSMEPAFKKNSVEFEQSGNQKGGISRDKKIDMIKKDIDDNCKALVRCSEIAKTYKEALMKSPTKMSMNEAKEFEVIKKALSKSNEIRKSNFLRSQIDSIRKKPKEYTNCKGGGGKSHEDHFIDCVKSRIVRVLHCAEIIGASTDEVVKVRKNEVIKFEMKKDVLIKKCIKEMESKKKRKQKHKNKSKKKKNKINKGLETIANSSISFSVGRRSKSLTTNVLCASKAGKTNDLCDVDKKNVRPKTIEWARVNIFGGSARGKFVSLGPSEESENIFYSFDKMSLKCLVNEVKMKYKIDLSDNLEIIDWLKNVDSNSLFETEEEASERYEMEIKKEKEKKERLEIYRAQQREQRKKESTNSKVV